MCLPVCDWPSNSISYENSHEENTKMYVISMIILYKVNMNIQLNIEKSFHMKKNPITRSKSIIQTAHKSS